MATSPVRLTIFTTGMSEIVFMVACGGASGTIIVQAEETIARALSVRWQEYDIPGNFKW